MNADSPALADRRRAMEARVLAYFKACNDADVDAIASCLTEDAVHYFPPGMYEGPWRGARVIASHWARLVATIGSAWTADRLICDPLSYQAVAEWTHYKTATGTLLRGDEWYAFEPGGWRITEIRAYYAAPQPDGMQRAELDGFDYQAAGYHLTCPVPRPPLQGLRQAPRT